MLLRVPLLPNLDNFLLFKVKWSMWRMWRIAKPSCSNSVCLPNQQVEGSVECTYVVASDVTCTAQIYGFSLWNNRLGCGWCAVIGTGPDRSSHTRYNCMKSYWWLVVLLRSVCSLYWSNKSPPWHLTSPFSELASRFNEHLMNQLQLFWRDPWLRCQGNSVNMVVAIRN